MAPATHGAAAPYTFVQADGVSPLRAKASMTETAHRGASLMSQELARFNARLQSADADYLWERDDLVARTRDIERNSGWVSGAMQSHVDSVIGQGLRLALAPSARLLGQDEGWAREFADEVEGKFHAYAEDPRNLIDASRQSGLSGLLSLAYRHGLVDGEALAVGHMAADDRGPDQYRTAVQVVDPDRLSNPQGQPQSDRLRSGVEMNDTGAAIAYHIRRGHPADYGLMPATDAWTWERVTKTKPWGRPQVIHYFDRQRAGQTRGKGLLTPVIEKLAMIDKFDRAELQAAVLNTVLAAHIESPFDPEIAMEALRSSSGLDAYQKMRTAFHQDDGIAFDGVQMAHLFPGEKLSFSSAERPNANHESFVQSVLRHVSSAVGLTYEQVSRDWSGVNYSSARAALLEVHKFLTARRYFFARGVATPILIMWLEEAVALGRIETWRPELDFWRDLPHLIRGRWRGPARGWIDPTKEAQAALMRIDASISTLENEASEQGLDWEEVLQQRKREYDRMKELGLPEPTWAVISNKPPEEYEEDPDARDDRESRESASSRIGRFETSMADLRRRASARAARGGMNG